MEDKKHMESLKTKLNEEGRMIGKDILKVSDFLNHQIDVPMMKEIGRQMADRFKGENIDKVLTAESGGIAVAMATAEALVCRMALFAKKTVPNTMSENRYRSEARSFTKGSVSELCVDKALLNKGERILIVDDFLAHGQAALALADIAAQAGCQVAGIGAVIEKSYQGGAELLREKGFRVESLCRIKEIKDGNVIFG